MNERRPPNPLLSIPSPSKMMNVKIRKPRRLTSKQRATMFQRAGGDPRGFVAFVAKCASRRRARQTHPGKRGKRVRHYA